MALDRAGHRTAYLESHCRAIDIARGVIRTWLFWYQEVLRVYWEGITPFRSCPHAPAIRPFAILYPLLHA